MAKKFISTEEAIVQYLQNERTIMIQSVGSVKSILYNTEMDYKTLLGILAREIQIDPFSRFYIEVPNSLDFIMNDENE